MKVSVVVPVYNPGSHIDDCIRTLLDQSLPRDEYEVIFVDDGSTDDTPARLDALAAEHENVRVEHIPNSGWPGRPRNIGIEMARGEYVYFVDNDDWVGREALERMYVRAERDDADVVVGKVVGHGLGKRVPNGVFRENRSNVGFEWTPLLWLLTPHKLFRRSLLDEHAIRFPEGRRRLEDHMFVVHAYFHARSISILADYACYHWVLRDADENASTKPFDAATYYGFVREVLDLVDEHTEPGELRDRLYLHWYRGKLLGRVGTKHFLRWDEQYRRDRYEEVRRLAIERFDPRIERWLPAGLRLRARLLRDGDYDGLVELARRERRLRAVARAVGERHEGDDLVLDLEVSMARGARELLQFERVGERVLWAPPEPFDVLDEDARDVTAELPRTDPYVVVRSVADHSEFALPLERTVDLRPSAGDGNRLRPVITATARVNARTAAAGAPLPPGQWMISSIPNVIGFKERTQARTPEGDPLTLSIDDSGRITVNRRSFPSRAATRLRRSASARLPWLARTVRRVRGRSGSPRPA